MLVTPLLVTPHTGDPPTGEGVPYCHAVQVPLTGDHPVNSLGVPRELRNGDQPCRLEKCKYDTTHSGGSYASIHPSTP
jgi:hypothetical protein